MADLTRLRSTINILGDCYNDNVAFRLGLRCLQKSRLGFSGLQRFSNSYTMGCPPVRGDNPRALASGLSYVQADKHGITILYHLHRIMR